jgi:hypothetical protein
MKLALGILCWVYALQASAVTLAWQASPDATVTGYKLYYGVASGVYTNSVNVGTNLTCRLTNLVLGVTYYFVVTAYNAAGLESLPSNEVSWFARLAAPVMRGEPWVRLTPVIEHSTDLLAWESFEGEPTWLPATNAMEFFATRRLLIEPVQRVSEP